MPTSTPGSSNPFPSVLFVEGAAPATPASGKQRLFVDIADGLLKLKDDAGTVTPVGGASGVTDHGALTGLADDDHTQYQLRSTLTTRGDLYYRGASAVGRLGIGSSGDVLTSDGTDAAWAAPSGGAGGGDLVFLGEDLLASDNATMTVTGIPSTYRDLVIVLKGKSSYTGAQATQSRLRVGHGSIDSGGHYASYSVIVGTFGNAVAEIQNAGGVFIGMCPTGTSIVAGVFLAAVVEIIDYASAHQKQVLVERAFWYDGTNNAVGSSTGGGSWDQTTAIDQIRVHLANNDYKAGSRLTVYGRT